MAPLEKPCRVQFGPFEVNLRSGELHRQGKKIHLQDQPFHVLSVLLERAGDLVTREELRRQVWPSDTFLEFDYALNTAIKKIRIALSDDAVAPRYVQTIPKRGYRWVAPAVSVDEREAPGVPAPDKAWPIKMRTLAWGILLGVLLSAIAQPFSRLPLLPLAVTVLPVRNQTGDLSLDLLCRGISLQLIGYLAQSDGSPRIISVPAEADSRDGGDVHAAEKNSGSQYALETDLRTSAKRVEVDIELTRARDHARIWAGSFEHALGDPLRIEADLARDIGIQVASVLRGIGP
jgi:DNA-binding winged helix-turn-helix (wHTH) protein/TolB-like protein